MVPSASQKLDVSRPWRLFASRGPYTATRLPAIPTGAALIRRRMATTPLWQSLQMPTEGPSCHPFNTWRLCTDMENAPRNTSTLLKGPDTSYQSWSFGTSQAHCLWHVTRRCRYGMGRIGVAVQRAITVVQPVWMSTHGTCKQQPAFNVKVNQGFLI